MQDSLFRTLLSNILESCVGNANIHLSENLVTLIDALASSSSNSAALGSKMLLALSSPALQEKIWNVVRLDFVATDVKCRTYGASLHRETVASMIALILRLVVSSRSAEPSLPHALTTTLIMKQRNIPYVSLECSHATVQMGNQAMSLFQQESTPFTGQHLQNWRDRLKSELEGQNSYQRDSIVRSVAQICQDLETRCNTVEEPLRREKARSQEFEQRVEELNKQVATLESQAADDRFHLDGLEDEKLSLVDERDQISAKLNELRLQFEEANRNAEDVLRNAREEFNARDLALRSTILNREEQLRSRDDKVQELNSTVGQVKGCLEHTEEELRALGERFEDLQARLENTGRQLDEERNAKFRQSEEILRLKERSINLEHQLQTTESEMEAVSGQLSDLGVSHEELKQSSESRLREMKVAHAADLETAVKTAKEEHDKLSEKLTDTLETSRQLKIAYDKTHRELHALQDAFSALEMKAGELDVLCAEQEEELEELRTLRRNVLASMGLAAGGPLAIRAASRMQQEGAVPETPHQPTRETRERRRRKSAIHTQDFPSRVDGAADGSTNPGMENAVEASFVSTGPHSQDGSTPKRQRPRPSFKVPAMQTPFSQRPILASRSTSKKLSPVKRSVLRQMSPNRRHTTVGLAAPEGSQGEGRPASSRKRRGSHREPSQEDLDMDDFLAGTPFTPGAFTSGTGRLPEDEDVTTTEL